MTEKRARPRLKVSMPVQVIGRSIEGEKFREVCQTHDASAFGLGFVLQSIVERGTILFLSMRMPPRLRRYDLAKDIYQIFAQVEHVKILAQGGCEVGVSFLGKTPPSGYEQLMSAEYATIELKIGAPMRTSSGTPPAQTVTPPQPPPPPQQPPRANVPPVTSAPPARPAAPPPPAPKPPAPPTQPAQPATQSGRRNRRDSRHQIPIDVTIEFLDAAGKTIYKEPGLITNISKHGACVLSTHDAPLESRLKVTMMREDFAAQATVKAVTTGQGGVWNLHIEFIDKCWMGGT